MDRPTGVTLLAVFFVLAGVFLFFAGFLFTIFGAFLIEGLSAPTNTEILIVFQIVLIFIMGVVDIVTGYGFIKGRDWAWLLGVFVILLTIISSIITVFLAYSPISIVWIVIYLIVLLYLFKKNVRNWFGVEL